MTRKELEDKVAHLEGRIAELEGSPQTTHVAIVQDKSGSMAHLRDDTIGGLNSYIRGLREDAPAGKVHVTLTQFDTSVRTLWEATPLHLVKDLTSSQYQPSGMTALYDALGGTINATADVMKPGDRALVIVMTDGYENSSREFNQDAIKELIESKQGLGNWTFVYLGAGVDAWAAGGGIGMHQGNTYSYAATSDGTSNTFSALTGTSSSYLRSKDAAVVDFADQITTTTTKKKKEDKK